MDIEPPDIVLLFISILKVFSFLSQRLLDSVSNAVVPPKEAFAKEQGA
jgi:hypothetical protein